MAKRYEKCNQKTQIKEEQTIQWRKDTKCNQKPYIKEGQTIQWRKDTKSVIRSHISKKDRQYNGEKEKNNMKLNDVQNTTQNTKNREC